MHLNRNKPKNELYLDKFDIFKINAEITVLVIDIFAESPLKSLKFKFFLIQFIFKKKFFLSSMVTLFVFMQNKIFKSNQVFVNMKKNFFYSYA